MKKDDKLKQKDKKNSKMKKLLKAVVIIAILIIILLLIYFIVKKDNEKVENNKNIITTTKENITIDKNDWYKKDKSENIISIYFNEESNSYIDVKNNNTEIDLTDYQFLNNYYCTSKDCTSYGSQKSLYIIKDSEKYYYYDSKNDLVKDIKVLVNLKSATPVLNENEVYGIVLINDEHKYGFYNDELNKITIPFKYDYIDSYSNTYIKDIILAYIRNTGTGVGYALDTKNGEEKYKFSTGNIGTITNENNIYYYENFCEGDCFEAKFYNENFKLLLNGDLYSQFAVSNKGNLAVKNKDNTFSIYNKNGSLIKKSKVYKEVSVVANDYISVVDNDDILKLIDYDGNVVAKFIEVTDNYKLHPMISGWYTENGKNGIYLVVEDTNLEFGTKGSGLEFYYIPSTGEKGTIETEGVGGYAKPILYLYPEKNNTNIEITFEKPYLLTTTYPKYKNSWNVIANKNGDIYDLNNKYYYALYWEEESKINIKFEEGFYVTKENAIDFLEQKLTYIGLNDKERNEFIMYWLPILEKNEKSLVYFELTNERQKSNRINIKPNPDSLLRVAIHIKKVNKKQNIKEQKLISFKRKGFTVVEWGGFVH